MLRASHYILRLRQWLKYPCLHMTEVSRPQTLSPGLTLGISDSKHKPIENMRPSVSAGLVSHRLYLAY